MAKASQTPGPSAEVQVAPEHYEFENYDDKQRWSSYWYQIRAGLALRPRTALEIGSGSGVFKSYLANAGVDIRSADIDPTRKPDYLVSVKQLDTELPDGVTFDLIAAFQILEHLPFEDFETCLRGIARRSRHALISLPRNGWQIRVAAAFGGLKASFGVYLPYPYRHRYNSQHYWELGRGYSIGRVTRVLSNHFDVEQRFRIPENPYHYLWVLRSKQFAGRHRDDVSRVP